MAFTVNLDDSTEKTLQDISNELGLKNKTKTIRYLIQGYKAHRKLVEDCEKIKRENEVLCDINFASRISNSVVNFLSKKL